jgi:hypothetical protein
MVLTSEREGGEASGGDSDSISPSNLHWKSLCFCVLCFSAAPSHGRRGALHIAFLVQAERHETKMDGIGGLRPKRAWVAWPGHGPRHHVSFGPWGSSR